MSIRVLLLSTIVAIAAPFGAAQALMLDTWNVDELDTSDDYVDLQIGTFGARTTLTLQWVAGADDTPGALGIDKLFINNRDASIQVVAVFVDTILGSNDVSGDWLPTNGSTDAGGGFGRFSEKVKEPSGDGGIDPHTLIFVLDGLYAPLSFVPNANGAAFAVHVRYGNGCSGWAADGGTAGASGSDSDCGGRDPVPEPSAALAFGAGVLVVGSALRRRR